MTLGTKRFYLARFGSENCCTFARQIAKVVYIILKITKKVHIYLCIRKLFCNFALSFEEDRHI